jgi:hypothetical protein
MNVIAINMQESTMKQKISKAFWTLLTIFLVTLFLSLVIDNGKFLIEFIWFVTG